MTRNLAAEWSDRMLEVALREPNSLILVVADMTRSDPPMTPPFVAELVRRLQEYERFKQAAEDLDALPRQDRDTTVAHAFMPERAAVKLPPPVDLKEMLMALHDVLKRAELFTGHAIKREALSVRQRMGDVLTRLEDGKFHRFESMFTPEEGKLGVLVTFLAMLELAKEQLLDIVQEAPLAPIYIKSLALNNTNEPLQFSSEFDDSDAANDSP